MKQTTSLRLDPALRSALSEAARREETSVSDLVERFVREGLAMEAHPGIVFKPGPSGRRAALAGGPDVWEVFDALRRSRGSERTRIRHVADEFGLHERQVVIAFDYAAAHTDEVEARIAMNERALDAAEQAAARRAQLLA